MKNLILENITPAEGEAGVRSYHCTYYNSRLLGMKAHGYLEVTNKRVIFQALGESHAGSSIIQSEVPMADISGINSYKGTFFSILHILGALIVSFVVFSLIPVIMTLIQYSAEVQNDTWIGIIWGLTILTFIPSFLLKYSSIWRVVLASASAAFLSTIAALSFLSDLAGSFLGSRYQGSTGWQVIVLAGLVIYILICIINYARRPTFTLGIGSKGGSSTPINISGASGLGIFDVAAGKALTAEPAEQAEEMLEELGAVIMDIQSMGDFGINKWKKTQNVAQVTAEPRL
jgi:hypothetical protein